MSESVVFWLIFPFMLSVVFAWYSTSNPKLDLVIVFVIGPVTRSHVEVQCLVIWKLCFVVSLYCIVERLAMYVESIPDCRLPTADCIVWENEVVIVRLRYLIYLQTLVFSVAFLSSRTLNPAWMLKSEPKVLVVLWSLYVDPRRRGSFHVGNFIGSISMSCEYVRSGADVYQDHPEFVFILCPLSIWCNDY